MIQLQNVTYSCEFHTWFPCPREIMWHLQCAFLLFLQREWAEYTTNGQQQRESLSQEPSGIFAGNARRVEGQCYSSWPDKVSAIFLSADIKHYWGYRSCLMRLLTFWCSEPYLLTDAAAEHFIIELFVCRSRTGVMWITPRAVQLLHLTTLALAVL